MKTSKEQYMNESDVCRAYGKKVCDVLQAFHSVTGCDITSCPYKVGKMKAFRMLVVQNKFNLLPSSGILQSLLQRHENMLTLMQTVM